jgi:hypothetical protein
LLKGDAHQSAGRVVADTGERPKDLIVVGNPPAVFADDLTGAFLKILGAAIIAEPGPQG